MAAIRCAGMRVIRSIAVRGGAMCRQSVMKGMLPVAQAGAFRHLSMSAPVRAAASMEEEEQPPAELEHAVESEIAYEEAQSGEDGIGGLVTVDELTSLCKDAMPGFEVDVMPGSSTMKFTRVVGDRTVTVKVDCCNPETYQADEEEEEEESGVQALHATVDVERTGQSDKLMFAVLLPMEEEGVGPEINHVLVLGKGQTMDDAEKDDTYLPSDFSELDTGLQGSFAKYLDDLGISFEFIDGVRDAAEKKEQLEYVTWLKRVRGAVSGTAVSNARVIDA